MNAPTNPNVFRNAVNGPAKIKPLKIRLALQGGGALGAYAAGVIMALDSEPRIEITEGTGLSAGANNLFVYDHAGIEGLKMFWRIIGKNGDNQSALVASYAMAAFGFGRQKTPLDYIRAALQTSIEAHALNKPKLKKRHATTVTKIDLDGSLALSNVREVTHSGDSFTIDAALASSTLDDLAKLESTPSIMIKGEPHWDGVYSGKNPSFDMLSRRSKQPVVVVTVDELEPRKSHFDKHVLYGGIFSQIEELRRELSVPVETISLQHKRYWSSGIRSRPSTRLFEDLFMQGQMDTYPVIEKLLYDNAPHLAQTDDLILAAQ